MGPITRTYVDADGHLINRRGDSARLGRLVDQGSPEIQLQTRDFAVLASKDAPTDILTVPKAAISGVESAELTKPGAENYFADAWEVGRELSAQATGTHADDLPRNTIALAVNSQGGRSQDRLHIHADRLDPELGQNLHNELLQGEINGAQWSNVDPVHGHQYRAIWVEGNDLTANPFQLVHDQLEKEHGKAYADSHMSQHTIAVVGDTNAQGQNGFIILDGRFDGTEGTGSAEEWFLGRANTAR